MIGNLEQEVANFRGFEAEDHLQIDKKCITGESGVGVLIFEVITISQTNTLLSGLLQKLLPQMNGCALPRQQDKQRLP